MMSRDRPDSVGSPDHDWPANGRLTRRQGLAVGRRVASRELPRAAQLHAIAKVGRCGTPAERADMLAVEPRSEKDAQSAACLGYASQPAPGPPRRLNFQITAVLHQPAGYSVRHAHRL
jgi:hypothetical protein